MVSLGGSDPGGRVRGRVLIIVNRSDYYHLWGFGAVRVGDGKKESMTMGQGMGKKGDDGNRMQYNSRLRV